MKNPFVINDYSGPELFCDREEETQLMIKYLTNGHNMVLVSPRRIGKTDLISHLFHQPSIQKEFITISVDIYSTKSFREFVIYLGNAITQALRPKGKAWINRFVEFLTSLKSQLTFDINGMPVWNIGIGESFTPDLTLDEIFQYLNSSDTPCIIAIDEFQQITKYKDAWKVEALLRTYIQHCGNTRFVFSGSHRHLMNEIFNSPARPFYASTTILNLPLIPEDKYSDFCMAQFDKGGKTLLPEVSHKVYEKFRGITAPMHRVMNIMYANTPVGKQCDVDQIDIAINEILKIQNDSYISIRYQLTETQYALLYAIAKDGEAKNIHGTEFIRRHKLISSSSVLGASRILLDRDLITTHLGIYTVNDPFLELWLQRQPLR
ncbi:MAG: ATPase [Bacteroidales bacterium]|nr:ATPase [Bacteroidales bacterium]